VCLGVDAEEARQLLNRAEGRISKVLEK